MKGKIFNAQETQKIQEAKNILMSEIDRLSLHLEKPKTHKKGYTSRELDEWLNYYDKKSKISYYKRILKQIKS
jgi:hypothetical protein